MQLALPLVTDVPDDLLIRRSLGEGGRQGGGGRIVLVRHRRARRYILRVLDDGTLRVTLPRWGSKREAQAFVETSASWIARQRQSAFAASRLRRDPLAEKNLRQRGVQELPPRLLSLAEGLGIAVTRVSIRNQRSRWGACSARGSITLNWRLILVPDFVRDYVMVHELMHRRELNHSERFWRHVAAACPRYEEARRWLLTEGQRLFTGGDTC
jgi:predicted metal-dependent hydrolase